MFGDKVTTNSLKTFLMPSVFPLTILIFCEISIQRQSKDKQPNFKSSEWLMLQNGQIYFKNSKLLQVLKVCLNILV